MKKCDRCDEELKFDLIQRWGDGGDKFDGYYREYWCKNCNHRHDEGAGILDIVFWHLRYKLYMNGLMTDIDHEEYRNGIRDTQMRWDSIDNSSHKL